MDYSCQATLYMGFLRKEYWSGLSFPFPRVLPNPGIKPRSLLSPELPGGFLTTSTTWEAYSGYYIDLFVSVQSLSSVQHFVTPWTEAHQAYLFHINAWSLFKLISISSSVIPFCSSLQSFPATGSFPMSQFFASGCQSIRTSASASVLPMNIQD